MDLQTKWIGEETKDSSKKESVSLLPLLVLIPIFLVIIILIISAGAKSGEGAAFLAVGVLVVSAIVILPVLIYSILKDTVSSIKHYSEGDVSSKKNKTSIIINIGLSIFLVGIIVWSFTYGNGIVSIFWGVFGLIFIKSIISLIKSSQNMGSVGGKILDLFIIFIGIMLFTMKIYDWYFYGDPFL